VSDGHNQDKAQRDGRLSPRRRVLKAGIIAFNNRHSTLSCTVRDLSAVGARLRLDGSVSAPDTFELVIELDGLEAPCQVMWRRAPDIGVKFLSEPRMVTPKRVQIVASGRTDPVTLRRKLRPDEKT
jgi:hypothetical protein